MDYNKILNKNAVKILDVLSRESLYFNQICELTGIKSKNNLLKNLNLLVNSNVLKKQANKSNTFYSLNYDNAVGRNKPRGEVMINAQLIYVCAAGTF